MPARRNVEENEAERDDCSSGKVQLYTKLDPLRSLRSTTECSRLRITKPCTGMLVCGSRACHTHAVGDAPRRSGPDEKNNDNPTILSQAREDSSSKTILARTGKAWSVWTWLRKRSNQTHESRSDASSMPDSRCHRGLAGPRSNVDR